MDAATRAELDALRVRAYGPAPDIAGDPGALARLIALEELALPPVPPSVDDGSFASAPPPADALPPAAIEVTTERVRSRRPVWHAALVVAVALATVPLAVTAASRAAPVDDVAGGGGSGVGGVREALAFVGHADADPLIQVRVDGSFGDYVDIYSEEVPLFPVEGPMTWVEPLGDYFGWKLWIGSGEGTAGIENCLLLDGDATMRAKCVPADLKTEGALLVSVPYDAVAPAERPDQMDTTQSLGFWWGPEGVVTILLGPSVVDPGGTTSLLDTRAPGTTAAAAIPILIDRVSGDFVDLSAISDAPVLPASGEMSWAQPLGEHFGWRLWVGSAPSRRGDEYCILLTNESAARSHCAPGEWNAEGDLAVALPFAQISPEDRPEEMTPDQSVTFVWADAGFVTVRLAPTVAD